MRVYNYRSADRFSSKEKQMQLFVVTEPEQEQERKRCIVLCNQVTPASDSHLDFNVKILLMITQLVRFEGKIRSV